MGDLIPRRSRGANSSLAAFIANDRTITKAAREIVQETAIAGVKLDALASFTQRAMEHTADLDEERRALAGDNPALNAALSELEIGFISKARNIQEGIFNEWPV